MNAQRLETIRHLNLSPGERVLSIGCGPGFLCESMAKIVGPKGAVVGVDISTDLIALCNRRKARSAFPMKLATRRSLINLTRRLMQSYALKLPSTSPKSTGDLGDASRSEAKRPNRFCCNGLDHHPVAFRQSKTHGDSHEIVGGTFRTSAAANVHAAKVYQCGISI